MANSKPVPHRKTFKKRQTKKHKDRTILVLICVGLACMISFGTVYSQQSDVSEVVAEIDTVKPQLDHSCQQKLLGYLQQGGVDIEAKMHHGDLQSCDFSSQAEQVRLAASKRSWGMR